MYTYIYIYICKLLCSPALPARVLREAASPTQSMGSRPRTSFTVGFQNFDLRIFNLRVSNPNKLIVDVFVDTMSDFNVPGSRPNKNTMKFQKSTV